MQTGSLYDCRMHNMKDRITNSIMGPPSTMKVHAMPCLLGRRRKVKNKTKIKIKIPPLKQQLFFSRQICFLVQRSAKPRHGVLFRTRPPRNAGLRLAKRKHTKNKLPRAILIIVNLQDARCSSFFLSGAFQGQCLAPVFLR